MKVKRIIVMLCDKNLRFHATALMLLLCFVLSHGGPADQSRVVVDFDLNQGQVKGESEYIQVMSGPTTARRGNCDGRAVLRIDTSGPYKTVRFVLRYARPRLWSFHVADTLSDGYGGGATDAETYSTSESHISNKQLRIYSNQLPGYHDATINGGLLLKVANNVIDINSSVTVQISDERIQWQPQDKRKQYIESKFLYRFASAVDFNAANIANNDKKEEDLEDRMYDRFLYVGLNRVVADDFRRGSGLCQATVILIAENVAHCKAKKNRCHKDANCYDTRRSYRCRCKPGFYGNGNICEDENECEYNINGGCIHTCTNSAGNYSCSCHDGFELAPDQHNCIDIDECAVDNGGCAYQCTNEVGSHKCSCPRGQTLGRDGRSCLSPNQCSRYGCITECTRSDERCRCQSGYRFKSGKGCIKTCAVGNGGCHHICQDTEDGVVCECWGNYIRNGDQTTCTVTCGVNNGGCDRRCNDTIQGPVCSCPEGLVLASDSKTCHDIDECAMGRARCAHECINTYGSFECVCPHGYAVGPDKFSCVDINECEDQTTCDHICYNSLGSYQCQCYPGYSLYGHSHCADSNECAVNNGGCAHSCSNTEGGYECSCRSDFALHGNGRDCEKLTKCIAPETAIFVETNCEGNRDEMNCTLSCEDGTHSVIDTDKLFGKCSQSSNYIWAMEKFNPRMFTCSRETSSAGYRREMSLMFLMNDCGYRQNENEAFKYDFMSTISDILSCRDLCRISNVEHYCGTRRRKYDRYTAGTNKKIVQVRFTVHLDAPQLKNNCKGSCTKRKTLNRMKKMLKVLRRALTRELKTISIADKTYEGIRDSLKRTNPVAECDPGRVLVQDTCVSCSLGTYYDMSNGTCKPCLPGFYQDREGQIACAPCPHNKPGVGLPMAIQESDCIEQCEPGTSSRTGLKPCQPCPRGSYQNQHGRIRCIECGSGVTTSRSGATGFQYCQVRAHCEPGHFYNKDNGHCNACPRNSYQPDERQNFCLRCPAETRADFPGSVNSTQCKDRKCVFKIENNQGLVQTPNWPGEYPINSECTWKISPPKGRRILMVIPEIDLEAEDKCGDQLVMRKSESKYSLLTYETCEPALTPLAITAHSRKLWVRFNSDSRNTAQGFSIPYVMYDEEYQELIEDIVRDGRLYSLYQHQEVLKNRKLLSALLEVIAEPYKYFHYVNASESMFPDSFIRLLRNKVVRFFSRP